MFDISPNVIAILIPILVVIGVFATVIVGILSENRRKELAHKERLIAMDKGLPLPEKEREEKNPRYLSIRAWGLVMAFLGVAVVIGISAEAGLRHGMWGLCPLGVGAALLIAAYTEKKDLKMRERSHAE
jgi:hypothetical protein